MENKKKWIEEEITLFEFAKRFLHLNDFKTPQIIDTSNLAIEVLSEDLKTKNKCWQPILNYVVKPEVKFHYSDGLLKGTKAHRIIEDNKEIYLGDHADFRKIDEPMDVVDISVANTKCYYANGRLNHNTTTPGGKALKFAATLRIKLMGKTPVKVMDPSAEREYKLLIDQWEADCIKWKNAGGSKGTGQQKPIKPKKPKGDEVIIGYDVIARTDKNKVGPPKREAEFRIIFGQGIIQEYAWFDYALKFALLELDGSFDYVIPAYPKIKKFRRVSWINILKSDPKLKEYFRKEIVSKLVKTAADYIETSEKETADIDYEEVIEKTEMPNGKADFESQINTEIENPELLSRKVK